MSQTPHHSLKVLNVVLSIGETSGPYNEHCLALCQERDITLCSFFPSHITPPARIRSFFGDGSFAGFLGALRAALRAQPYDIIHVHSPHVGVLFLIAAAFLQPSLLSTAVYTVQNSYDNYKLRNRLLLIPIFACYHHVVCCSHASLQSFPRWFRRLAGPRLCVVQNGPDIERLDRIMGQNGRRQTTAPFMVASVGRLISIKNPLAVLRAFSHSDDRTSRLVFIGDGDLRELLGDEISMLGLQDRARLTGLIPRNQVFAELSHADVFISASRGEGLPFAVMEAMACCCPVILSDIEPHREIAHGTDFIPLIHPDDVDGFARELMKFRKMSTSERVDIGRKCRKLIEERFSLRAMHRRYEQVYEQLRGNSNVYANDNGSA